MAHYYKYNFISPKPVFAIIKEELKSYFDTGAIDDLMFPTYVTKCLRKLSRASLPIDETIIHIEDFQARLPDNFQSAREVWLCSQTEEKLFVDPSSFYSQNESGSSQIVTEEQDTTTEVELLPIVKNTGFGVHNLVYRRMHLLKPGNISAKQQSNLNYNPAAAAYGNSPGSNNMDSFDIRDNKLITRFRNGTIHLVFYSERVDTEQNQLIPDNYRIEEFVEAFIKYKVFEVLTNQINDETYNQMREKVMYYKQLCDEAYIMADIEIKKQTIAKKVRNITRDQNRFNKYKKATPSYNSYFNN